MTKWRKEILCIVSFVLFSFLVSGRAFSASPTLGTITPSFGSTAPLIQKTFTCKYSDLDGWRNLRDAYLLISTSAAAKSNAVYLYYNQDTNLLYLRDDADTTWLGGFTPGSANVIENSQVKLNCTVSSAIGISSTLSVNFNLTFKPAYSGKTYNSYLSAKDDNGYSTGTSKKGIYSINYSPTSEIITPSSGSGAVLSPYSFSTTYSDLDGWQNIGDAYFLINTTTSRKNCLYVYYNQNTNKLYLRNDTDYSWLGGYLPCSSFVIENSYAKLNCGQTTVSGVNNTLTINWNGTFKSTFQGLKNTYLYVRDDSNAYQNWTQKGTWSIQTDITPPTGVLRIKNDNPYTNSAIVTLNLFAEDNSGGISQMQLSNDNIIWAAQETYSTSKSWTLPAGEGTKTVYVRYKDSAGNWSTVYSDDIILDTTAPNIVITAPVTANGNSPATNQNY